MSLLLFILLFAVVQSSYFSGNDLNGTDLECALNEDCSLVIRQNEEFSSTFLCAPGFKCNFICHAGSNCYRATIETKDSSIVSISCDSAECGLITINADNSDSVNIECNNIESWSTSNGCRNSQIHAANISDLSINCQGERACYYMHIIATFDNDIPCVSPNQFIMNCSGYQSCSGSTASITSTEDIYSLGGEGTDCFLPPMILCNASQSCDGLSLHMEINADFNVSCQGEESCQKMKIFYNSKQTAETQLNLICVGDIACEFLNIVALTASQVQIVCMTTNQGDYNDITPCKYMAIFGPLQPFKTENIYTLHNINSRSVVIHCNNNACYSNHFRVPFGTQQTEILNLGECGVYQDYEMYYKYYTLKEYCFQWQCGLDFLNYCTGSEETISEQVIVDDVLDQFDGNIDAIIIEPYTADTIQCDNDVNCYIYGVRTPKCTLESGKSYVSQPFMCPPRTINCGNQNCELFALEEYAFSNIKLNAFDADLVVFHQRFQRNNNRYDKYEDSGYINSTINGPIDGILYFSSDSIFVNSYINAANSKVLLAPEIYKSFYGAVLHLDNIKDARLQCVNCANVTIYIINEDRTNTFIPYDRLCIVCANEVGLTGDMAACNDLTIYVDDGTGDIEYCEVKYDDTTERNYCYRNGDVENERYILSTTDTKIYDDLNPNGYLNRDRCDISTAYETLKYINGETATTKEPDISVSVIYTTKNNDLSDAKILSGLMTFIVTHSVLFFFGMI